MSKLLGGFKHRYPQAFLDKLAKDLGFKWTKVKSQTMDSKDVPVVPLSPPSGQLFYLEMNYNNERNN